ncbi:arylesterase [Pandoraea norimbergensis]|uniref:Arylesterase n=1 Tax=Pandoraea norimbergensis TaxID=93219 RepID=A0ABN4JKC1_9BURK|nr:arylesterase [Pandoraea norimbergensis]ALS61434.1 arylesterase [Pandoraea norimbergensis]
MARRQFLKLAASALVGCCILTGTAAHAASSGAPTILVVGDSLSAEYGIARGAGWVNLMQQKVAQSGFDYNVVNASISGDTTSGGRARLAPLLDRYHPAITILELGGNDALRGISLDLTRANLREMIESSRKAGSRVIVVGMRIPPNYGTEYGEQFFSMFATLAKQEKTGYVPFLLDGVIEHPDWFQQDQIHPLAKAHPQILQNVWPTVAPLLKPAGKAPPRAASGRGVKPGA